VIHVYIATRGRADKQKTWDNLPSLAKKHTTLFVPKEELKQHLEAGRFGAVACPTNRPTGMCLADTRDFILTHAKSKGYERIVLLDDDIALLVRAPLEEGVNPRFLTAEPGGHDWVEGLSWLEQSLKTHAHAAWGMRQHHWDYETNANANFIEVGRALGCCMGFNVKEVVNAGASFTKGIGKGSPMSDFNITLQLLLAGKANRVSLVYRASPGPANAPGGCAGARTAQLQSDTAAKLGRLYPEVVKVVQKKAWGGMESATMNDVAVGWKRAYKLGGAK
jgi:hypothetical protein